MTELIASQSRLLIHVFKHEVCNTERVKSCLKFSIKLRHDACLQVCHAQYLVYGVVSCRDDPKPLDESHSALISTVVLELRLHDTFS
jgi:hypothetical protein